MDFLTGVDLHPSIVFAVVALNVIGYALKSTPNVPNWSITWTLIALGAAIGVGVMGFSVEGVANGVVAGGMAIAAHQVVKQTSNK